MKSSLRRLLLVVALASGSAAFPLACGASINAVYEGDVRFEHCMALDEQTDAKAAAQKGCWEEWVKYYTFGQTRDRVSYARQRQKQLSGESGLGDGAPAPQSLAQRVVPEPTTVLAPPPQLILADAGRPAELDAAAPASSTPDASELPAAACAAQCGETWASCKKVCSNAACEKTCATAYKRCMKKCF